MTIDFVASHYKVFHQPCLIYGIPLSIIMGFYEEHQHKTTRFDRDTAQTNANALFA